MNKRRSTFFKTIKIIPLLLVILHTADINALNTPQHGPPPPPGLPIDSIPLDGGLGILLAAAAFFGIKKLRQNKNDKF